MPLPCRLDSRISTVEGRAAWQPCNFTGVVLTLFEGALDWSVGGEVDACGGSTSIATVPELDVRGITLSAVPASAEEVSCPEEGRSWIASCVSGVNGGLDGGSVGGSGLTKECDSLAFRADLSFVKDIGG